MIINIRGTSGSGKSTVIFDLMEQFGFHAMVPRGTRKWEAVQIHAPWGDVYAIGQYKTQCGGCDGVPTQDEVCRLVTKYSKKGHVIFEGLIVTSCYLRYRILLPTLGDYRMCFLNTPLRTCISRIKKRRLKKGNTKPFNPENTEAKFYQTRRTIERAQKDGVDYYILDYKHATEEVICLLKLGIRM